MLVVAVVGLEMITERPLMAVESVTPPAFVGVNLAGGEFGSDRVPGVYAKDYIYPSRTTAEPFKSMGMNAVRLPLLWERLQPKPQQPLSESELALLDKSIAELSDFDMVILDVHNYGRYGGVALDQPERSAAMLADLWTRLAQRYKDSPQLAFGIMNEPHGIDARTWRKIADEALGAIRRAGATNLVLVPGTHWTGAHSWTKGGSDSNAAAFAGFKDPAGNWVFEMHQYLDSDSSGTKSDCSGPKVGSERLIAVTSWLREQRAKAILGEFGAPATPTCLAALDDLLAFLRNNGDVWIGWTYWAGGDWWGDYPMSVQPNNGKLKPQAAVLQKYAAVVRPTKVR